MGAVQRLATVVIVGLVALSTILVLYLADESNRIKAEEKEQQEAAIERGTANYLSLCVSCHGPAGKGYSDGSGHIGMPLNTTSNQTGINEQGTPVAGGLEARVEVMRNALHNGRGLMPAWGEENAGPLNADQIEELLVFIQHADWNLVYNEAVDAAGGFPTAPAQKTAEPSATEAPAAGSFNVAMEDIKFDVTELTIPADQDVTINLVNNGASTHNFTVADTDIASGDYASGQTGTVTVNLPAGEYEFFCSVPGHKEAGMVGKLIVSADAAAAPAAETPAVAAAAGESPAADAGAGAAAPVDVAMQDISFDTKEITIAANTDVTFNLVNNGAATHNFTVTGTDFTSGDYTGGQTGTLVVNLPPGEYEYDCTIPGHKEAGMVGKLIVQ